MHLLCMLLCDRDLWQVSCLSMGGVKPALVPDASEGVEDYPRRTWLSSWNGAIHIYIQCSQRRTIKVQKRCITFLASCWCHKVFVSKLCISSSTAIMADTRIPWQDASAGDTRYTTLGIPLSLGRKGQIGSLPTAAACSRPRLHLRD